MGLDRRGGLYEVFNAHLPHPARMVLPVFYSTQGYGIFIDNSWPASFDMGSSKPDGWTYQADGGDLDVYVFIGTLPNMVRQFTELTGRPALLPRWALGSLQSRFGYRNREELEEIARTFRAKKIPCDALFLDLYWFKHMGDLCFDTEAFPAPRQMLQNLREQGFRVLLIQQPYVVPRSRNFAEGKAKGYFAHFPDGRILFPFWISNGVAALVDITNPAAREWWVSLHEELVQMGIGGWWLDLTEPEQHYADMVHFDGPAAKVHNSYPVRMLETVRAVYDRYAPQTRPFLLSRGGWVGMARYGAGTWSGDIRTSFESLALQPTLGLGVGLVGIPGWSSDAGGFEGATPSPELYIRWMQFAAFSGIMRPHGERQPREPWAFGPEAEQICSRYIELRRQMVPYSYSALFEAYRTGAPLMRPLVWYYPHDPVVADMADEFFYGPGIMVAPVLRAGVRRRRVYLPEGRWYDFYTRKTYDGRRWMIASAPLERIPIFVRAGSVIPLAPLSQYEGERSDGDLTLTVWPHESRSVHYDLYEDDGETRAYEDGVWALTRITVLAGAWTVIIAKPKGSYASELPPRNWTLEVIRKEAPSAVYVGRQALPRARSADASTGGSGWYFDRSTTTLQIKIPTFEGSGRITITVL
jgi:alpha-glucosidase (family GH31 glycosyl hydrolase)